MKKKFSKPLAIILAAMMLFSLMPAMAFAETGPSQITNSGLQHNIKEHDKSEGINTGEIVGKENFNVTKKIKTELPMMKAGAMTTTFKLGTNVTGTYDTTSKVLTISGTGEMNNWGTTPLSDISSSVTTINISEGITTIGNRAFSQFPNLKTINFPNSLISIGDFSVSHCSLLKSVTIPKNVEYINPTAFMYCSTLTTVNVSTENAIYSSINGVLYSKDGTTLIYYPCGKNTVIFPTNVKTIGKYSICGNNLITSITIPSSVTTIEDYGISYCNLLTSVSIATNVSSISSTTFYYCNTLNSINVDASNPNFSSINGVLFNKNKTILIHCPCPSTRNAYTIPSTVVTIGDYAFANASKLSSVTIPAATKTIGSYAFSICIYLTTVIIPNYVTTIGEGAFRGSGLKNLTIGSSVANIGTQAFNSSYLDTITNLAPFNQNVASEIMPITTGLLSPNTKKVTVYAINTNFETAAKNAGFIVSKYATPIISSITVTPPIKLSYNKGEELDLSGGIVKATYTNGSTAQFDLTPDMVSGYNTNILGNQIIKVTLNGCIVNFNVTVKPKILDYISITNAPTKIEYHEGENFDAKGMIITATYTDGSTAVVTGTAVNGSSLTAATNNVTISYVENDITKTAIQPITVHAKELLSIAITTVPTKTEYHEGENFDVTGMVVTATYTDGSIAVVTGTAVNGSSLTVATSNVTISYVENGITKTVIQPIIVHAKELSSITITTAPTKTEYHEGENFNATGMVVTAIYSNGTTAVVNSTVANGNNLSTETNSVTISYTEDGITKTVIQPITINPKILSSIKITTAPTKMVYSEGESFDATGMVVTATYEDGSTTVVNGVVTNGIALPKGTDFVTVSYTKNNITKTTTQPITVNAKQLTSIAITTAPSKTTYTEGENFDATGIVVTATYSDGTTDIVNGTIDNGSNLTVGMSSVNISYAENGITKIATQPIVVNAKKLSSIAITTAPNKTTYVEGENFDTTGMVVTATFDDDSTSIVNGVITNGNALTEGETTVTISYTRNNITKTAIQPITVTAKELVSISITTSPTKIVYCEGEDFEATGMIVTATYTDGSTSVVNGTVNQGNSLVKGVTNVIISYNKNGRCKTAIQPITVGVNELVSLTITTPPTKTEYRIGEKFDPSGMIVTATFKNGSTAAVNGKIINGNELTLGTNVVTVSYSSNGVTKTISQEITVTDKELTSIAITTPPTKTVYMEGEDFDSDGMVITASYNNGRDRIVTGNIVDGKKLIVGKSNVIINYEEGNALKTIIQPIGVIPKSDTVTTSYALGINVTGKFDATTGVLTVSGTGPMKDYPDGSTSSPIHDIRSSIKYIVIEDGITTVGRYAFNNCYNLSAVIISNSVTAINAYAFMNDGLLSSIILGRSVKSIGDGVFCYCTLLSSITLTNSLTEIGRETFYKCEKLNYLELPDSIISIGVNGFTESGITSMVLPDSVTTIGYGCFARCVNLETITFSNRIKYIPKETLRNCNALTSVTIPNGVISLGASTFENCLNLSSIVLPETITEIETKCFYNCPNLNYISNLAKARQAIRDNAFTTSAKGIVSGTSYNYFFKKAVLDAGYSWKEALYDEMIYNLGPSIIGKIDQEGTLTVSGTGKMTNFTNQYPIFYQNGFIKKIIISEGVTNVGDYVFYQCGGRLSSIVIPDSVTEINQHAFDSAGADLVVIGKSVVTIGEKAFMSSHINTLKNLSKGDQTFGNQAFYQAANNFRDFKSTAYMYPENTRFYNAMKPDFNTIYLSDRLTGLEIIKASDKTIYVEGENFNTNGMIVNATYNDGSKNIIPFTVENGQGLSLGRDSVTISYTEGEVTKTVMLPIIVNPKALISIEITKAPNKTVYFEGENFDMTGMIITATYEDGSTSVVNGIATNGSNLIKGTETVAITYTKNNITKTVNQAIIVNARILTSIAVTTAPTKTVYIEAENFDATGMIVTATYSNRTTAMVTGTVENGNNLTVGTKGVNISYTENGATKTTTLPISVSAKKLVSIAVTTAPTKIVYQEGEDFDLTGMIITASYNNGTTAIILETVNDGKYLDAGTTCVAISYTEAGVTKTILQSITVQSKTVEHNLVLDCVQGKELLVPFYVLNASHLTDVVFTLQYEASNLEVIDLVALTKNKETTIGIVTGAGLEIISYAPGEIKFRVNTNIAKGKTWTGNLNIFKFRAKITGKTSFVTKYN